MSNRALSMISIKSVDTGRRTFSGWASTPSVDRVGDILNPLGARFAKRIPLLHMHKHDSPVGWVELGQPSEHGIPFTAEIPVISEPPTLKERVDVAWGEVIHGLVPAVSVGFSPQKYVPMANGGIRFEEFEVFELSLVSIPAQAEAVITAIKAFDDDALRAAGIDPEGDPVLPVVPAEQRSRVVRLADPSSPREAPFVIKKILR